MANSFLQSDAKNLEQALHDKGFTHLHVSKRGNSLVVYSKDGTESVNRSRLTLVGQKQYQLSMADHTGRWEPTPYKGNLEEMITMLTEEFSFALVDFGDFM